MIIAPSPVYPSPTMSSPPRHDPLSGKVVSSIQRGKHRSTSNTSSSLDRQNAQRKRQRRQAGAQLLTGLFAGDNSEEQAAAAGSPIVTPAKSPSKSEKTSKPKKKSTAQPRPEIQIPARGIGPVYEPNDNDVLCGRGGRINAHQGNVRFRDIVVHRKKDYLDPKTKKLEKAHIAADIVRYIRAKEPSGRFLKEDPDGSWYDIGDAKAIKKVGQALREDAPDIRDEIGSDEDGYSPKNSPKKSGDKHHHSAAGAPVQPLATVTLGATATAVSGRGAKKITAPSQRSVSSQQKTQESNYTPMAYQNITAPPATYQPILPPTHEQPKSFFSGRGRNPKPSGAAAAAMRHSDDNPSYPPPPTQDIAFGRSFHVPESANENSMLSGMSAGAAGPPASALSGMSGISALTDPISALSAEGGGHRPTFQQPASRNAASSQQFQAMRYNQLQQLRQQWSHGGQRTFEGQDMRSIGGSDMRSISGMSLQRSHSWQEGPQYAHNDTMSWADHSLLGGGIQDVNSVMSGQQSFHSYYLRDQPMGGCTTLGAFQSNTSGPSEGSMIRAGSSGLGGSSVFAGASLAQQNQPMQPPLPPTAQLYQGGDSSDDESSERTNRMAGAGVPSASGSVASMSIASGSLSGSIMSDLSENLVALDLAESRLLGQMDPNQMHDHHP